MSYEGWRPLLPYIACDECYKRLYKDDEDRVFNTVEDADFAAEALGWHRYEVPDGDPRHICAECAERRTDMIHGSGMGRVLACSQPACGNIFKPAYNPPEPLPTDGFIMDQARLAGWMVPSRDFALCPHHAPRSSYSRKGDSK